jgi:hypothetical protein
MITMRKYPQSLQFNLKYLDDHTIRKNGGASIEFNRQFMEILFTHLMIHPEPMVVPVYDFQILDNKGGVFHYQYDMKALLMLHAEEKRLVNRSFNRYEMYGELPSRSEDTIIQQGWQDWPNLLRFMEQWILLGRHLDIHDGNIMIDENDQYKLVDIEGFIHHPIDDPINDWIIR